MKSELVTLTIVDGVATVTLNRPEAMNVLDIEMSRQLRTVFESLRENDAVRVVILAGAGPYFLAGGDITFFRELASREPAERRLAMRDLIGTVHEVVRCIRTMPQPVIAQVQGGAAGIGLSFMAACDFAVVADNAKFTLAYINIASTPDGGASFSLTRLLGIKRATELMMLADRFDAAEAYRLGLVSKVVSPDALQDECARLASRLKAGPRLAYANTKKLVNQALNASLDEQLEAEEESFISCFGSPDFAEGLDAFLSKRKPAFS